MGQVFLMLVNAIDMCSEVHASAGKAVLINEGTFASGAHGTQAVIDMQRLLAHMRPLYLLSDVSSIVCSSPS